MVSAGLGVEEIITDKLTNNVTVSLTNRVKQKENDCAWVIVSADTMSVALT